MSEAERGGPSTIAILGSTGSIGTQALDIIARAPLAFNVSVLAATGRQPQLLAEQVRRFRPPLVAVSDPGCVTEVTAAIDAVRAPGDRTVRVVIGEEGMAEAASATADVVLNGIAGAAGLGATLAAIRAGNIVGLANKESLTVGGSVVLRAVAEAAPGAPVSERLRPVDSEHSAIWQCLAGATRSDVRELVLTASGGPFRGRKVEDLRDVTPEQALKHPTWSMGPLNTVNSATLVNKGLELIEAALLFGNYLPAGDPYDAVQVVLHPQSLVHSMVSFIDGSTIAQVSPPDMRLPISLAMGWPLRTPDAAPAMDWSRSLSMTFEPLDDETFPALSLARAAGRAGGTAPAVYTAANEAAVAAFLAGQASFLSIVETVERVLTEHTTVPEPTLEDVLDADRSARARAAELLKVMA